MFVIGNALIGLGVVIHYAVVFYGLILFGAVVVSWARPDPRNPLVRFLHAATEPAVRVVRGWLPASLRHFPLDIAFVVLLAIVIFTEYAVARTLIEAGYRMKGPRLY
jgi:YggT family protein